MATTTQLAYSTPAISIGICSKYFRKMRRITVWLIFICETHGIILVMERCTNHLKLYAAFDPRSEEYIIFCSLHLVGNFSHNIQRSGSNSIDIRTKKLFIIFQYIRRSMSTFNMSTQNVQFNSNRSTPVSKCYIYVYVCTSRTIRRPSEDCYWAVEPLLQFCEKEIKKKTLRVCGATRVCHPPRRLTHHTMLFTPTQTNEISIYVLRMLI